MDQIDVSVCIVTYNHEKFIKPALDSVLMQKTRFKYEIVVSDDCSRDGTMDIVRKYEREHPGVFKINHNETNEGIANNTYKSRCMCQGRYIIELAGDDYWIRDDVIETKAAFLDENENFFGISSRYEMRRDFETKGVPYPDIRECNRSYSFDGLSKGEKVNNRGLMVRNRWLTEDGRRYFKKSLEYGNVEDAVDRFLFLKLGDIWVSDDISEVYRQISGGSNYNSIRKEIEILTEYVTTNNKLYEVFGSTVSFRKLYVRQFAPVFTKIIFDEEYRNLYNSIPGEYRKPWYRSVVFYSIIGWIKYKKERVIYKIKMRAVKK